MKLCSAWALIRVSWVKRKEKQWRMNHNWRRALVTLYCHQLQPGFLLTQSLLCDVISVHLLLLFNLLVHVAILCRIHVLITCAFVIFKYFTNQSLKVFGMSQCCWVLKSDWSESVHDFCITAQVFPAVTWTTD